MTWQDDHGEPVDRGYPLTNVYPTPDNVQLPSFPQPVPAPDADPDEGSLLLVGYNPAWTPYIMAALDQLRQFGTWEGDDAAKLLAVNRAEGLKFLLQNPVAVEGGETVPFWQSEDGSDAGDEEPVETWYEEVSWWIIEAFVAVTVTPAAAITFVTTTRTLHLAFRRGGFGGLIRALIDDVEVALIDTYSAGTPVLEWVYDTGDDDEHTLRLEHTGEANEAAEVDPVLGGYRMDVIRKNIRFPLPNFLVAQRYDDATDTVQSTVDGGETWTDAPQSDPRQTNHFPPPATSDPRCDAAARMTGYVQELVTGVEDGLAAGALVGTLITFIAGSFAVWAGFLSLLWFLFEALATVFIDAGLSDLQDSFTSTFYTQLEGYFYCALGADGRITASGLQKVYDAVAALSDVTKSNVFGAIVNLLGAGGFNDLASTRTETGSCGSLPACTWTHDLLPSGSEVTPNPGLIFACNGNYRNHAVSGLNVQTKAGTLCWYWLLRNSRRSVQIELLLHLPPGCTLTTALFQFRNLAGGNLDTVLKNIQVYYAGNFACTEFTSGGNNQCAVSVSLTDQDVRIVAYMDENAAVKDFCIDFLQISGTGIDPLLA